MCEQKNYSKFKCILEKRNQLLYSGANKDYEQFNKVINYCRNALNFEYLLIIDSYLKVIQFPFWWTENYSTSSFYRKRLKAITSFVLLFELIYENLNDYSLNVNRSIF